jgi:hypothetical protein
MGQLSRQLAVLVLIAYGVVATAVAGPKPDPEPKQEAKPISSGMLDIDLCSDGWKFTGCSKARKGIVKVEASGSSSSSLRKSSADRDKNVKDPAGVAVYDGSVGDECLEKGEYLTVDMDAIIIADLTDEIDGVVGSGTVAFDVDDHRAQCQPGSDQNDPASPAYAQWSSLSINLDWGENNPVELVTQRHQCGYPDPERPNWPVIYVLELDGSRLEILEDSIAVEFYDDANRAANVIGNLLVQLDHLQWMIRSTLLGESPTDIPPLEVSAP